MVTPPADRLGGAQVTLRKLCKLEPENASARKLLHRVKAEIEKAKAKSAKQFGGMFGKIDKAGGVRLLDS